ncbi:MAG: hypothetical protein HY430_00965 [Candidatus Levybacteria bacterium]|nr:hypothetical protein [Candidatus Levybacteria bacterium]
MRDFLHHLLFPRESNNHKARILHHKSILLLVVLFFLGTFFLSGLEQKYPQVLGINANISSEELLLLTNQKRQENGLQPLIMNQQLSIAASHKAQDMFLKNYWAHNAPEGTTPWVFVKGAGYEYLYAGENLARGFTNSADVISAWMNSPGHRDNMLSPNYKEIGFAIQTGTLTGDDTVLVVEMLGSQSKIEIAQDVSSAKDTVPAVQEGKAQIAEQQEKKSEEQRPLLAPSRYFVASVQTEPLIDTWSFSKTIALGVLFILLVVLILDIIIIEKKKIVRVFTHNLDHVIFLGIILIIILIIGKEAIL